MVMLRPVALLAFLGSVVLACSADKPAPPTETPPPSESAAASTSPTPITTPGTSLTPRAGVSTDLGTAKRFESEGDLEAASEAYVAAAAKGGAEKGEATLGAARVLLELDRPADVRILLEPFVNNATGGDVAARYMLARAYAALELWAESLAQYDAYIASNRAALPYAYLDRSRDLVMLNQPVAAANSAQQGLNLGVPPGQRRAFILAIAQAYERAGSFSDAIRNYRNLIDTSDLAGDEALALSRIAAIKRDLNDPTYHDDIFRLVAGYPSTPQALQDMTDAIARGETFPPTVVGLVYYRNNDYTKAEPLFRQQIDAAPNAADSAEAYYYLAAVLESKSDFAGAKEDYATAAALNPASTIADDALWWRGRLLEDDGDRDGAGALYRRILNEYPNSTWASDAAFRVGLLPYRVGSYGAAGDAWVQALAVGALAGEQQRFNLWQAKARLKAGDKDGAKALLDPMARAAEDDYYGIRALGLLAGDSAIPRATRESKVSLTPSFDWGAAEAWLAQKTGRTVVAGAWASDYRWGRAQELWTVGRSSQGDAEAFDLIETYAQDSIAMYTLSRTLQGQGRIGMSARSGQRLLRTLNTNPNEGLPKPLLSLSYPPAFGPIVQKYADEEKISPLLMLAFIRQESFFDPRAISPAGALGLTQVLPTTGRSLSAKLGVTVEEDEDLLHADLNLRLGARYMADQLRSFDSQIFVAFAAYNAGPNGANRWRAASGDDADLFLETVEFKETRLYIELVAENYAIYRYLYADEDAPALP
ncbi:MAG TPA: transglycosylase SLT domain-containing protein [Dehalococcoidia bacterium]|nr:transglycosylase SLT domain-containing protein [Dehalococcoidia bacterium]